MSDLARTASADVAGSSGTPAISWLIENVRDQLGLFVGIASVIFAGVLLYVLCATPIYTADALIRVEPAKNSMLGTLGDLNAVMQGRASSTLGEIETLKSRSVIGQALRKIAGPLRKGEEQLQVRDLLMRLSVVETVPQSNVIRVEFSDANALFAANFVNALADVYLNANAQLHAQEAARSLLFLDEQLPQQRGRLDQAEAVFNEFRLRAGTIDIGGQVAELLARAAQLEQRQMELDLKRGELVGRFQPTHPALLALETQHARIQRELESLDARKQQLPEIQQTYLRMARDVDLNAQLYASLLDSAQQLRIAKAGTIANASIIDPAMPPEAPARPNRPLIMVLGTLFALLAAFAACQIVALSIARIRDADTLELASDMSTLAVIPHAPQQHVLDRVEGDVPRLIVSSRPQSATSDAVRSLRMALQIAVPVHAGARVLLLASAEPEQGKTFVACNLACALAAGGARVLLFDADIHRSSTHRYLGLSSAEQGLISILQGRSSLEAASVEVAERLTLVPAGRRVAEGSELLASHALVALIEAQRARYDWILIDGPPASVIGDAGMLTRVADQVLFVARHGKVSFAQVRRAVSALQRLGARFVGSVFNDHRRPALTYGYAYGYGNPYTHADNERPVTDRAGGMQA